MEYNERVIIVEYLESSMSEGLLTKFPDNSAFDFDYTQSSIWSPVVPRPFTSTNSTFDLTCGLSRRLFCCGGNSKSPIKTTPTDAIKKGFKRKFNAAVYDKFHQTMKVTKKANNAIGFDNSRLPSSSQTPKGHVFGKILKAASKQFKRKKNKKREATNVQIYNSNYFSDWDF